MTVAKSETLHEVLHCFSKHVCTPSICYYFPLALLFTVYSNGIIFPLGFTWCGVGYNISISTNSVSDLGWQTSTWIHIPRTACALDANINNQVILVVFEMTVLFMIILFCFLISVIFCWRLLRYLQEPSADIYLLNQRTLQNAKPRIEDAIGAAIVCECITTLVYHKVGDEQLASALMCVVDLMGSTSSNLR